MVSTPPVMLRAKLVTVIPSLVWVGVTPHQAGRRTRQRRACVRQAPMRSLRPTGGCRVGDRARPTDRTKTVPKDVSRFSGVRPGLGTHPHADQSVHRNGGSLSGQLNPRCLEGGTVRHRLGRLCTRLIFLGLLLASRSVAPARDQRSLVEILLAPDFPDQRRCVRRF